MGVTNVLFEFTNEQLELQDAVRSVLTKECNAQTLREALKEPDVITAKLLQTYSSLDWQALAIAEEYDGIGMTHVEQAILAEAMGWVADPTSFLSTTTHFAPLIANCGTAEQKRSLLPKIASGTLTGTFACNDSQGRIGYEFPAVHATKTGVGWSLSGSSISVTDGARVDSIGVLAKTEAGVSVFIIDSALLDIDTVPAFDPLMNVANITFDGIEVGDNVRLGNSSQATIERSVQEATIAQAASIVGTCQRIMEMTLEYVKNRYQFDVPIGSFQVVKHKMANMYIVVERARALAYFAALTMAEDNNQQKIATSMAKAAAGDAQRVAVQDGIQLFGGLGFTWENDLQLYVKHAKAGELILGNSQFHLDEVARLSLNA